MALSAIFRRIRVAGVKTNLTKNKCSLDKYFDRTTAAAPAPAVDFQFAKNSSSGTSISLENAFKLYEIDDGPQTTANVTKEDALKYYTQMVTIRRLEHISAALYKEKIIRGFCHLYTGQEAIAVGMKSAMREQDTVITAYRCHGYCYLMGVSALGLLAELTGRSTGCQRGKGGSMHMYTPKFFGGNGIVGAQVPLGVGIALALKYKSTEGVCFACYGDGAANQGQVFEAYNIACLLKLPVVFVCENNMYGMGTKNERSACNTKYYTRGHYISGIWVDGMNVLAARNAALFAIDYALNTKPIVLEMYTYRYMGHSMSDPGTSYRSREEVMEVRKTRDPITTFKELAIANSLMTEEDAKAIDEKVRAEIDKAGNAAKTDKEIELKELTADIYSNNLEPKIRSALGYTLPHMQINKGMNH